MYSSTSTHSNLHRHSFTRPSSIRKDRNQKISNSKVNFCHQCGQHDVEIAELKKCLEKELEKIHFILKNPILLKNTEGSKAFQHLADSFQQLLFECEAKSKSNENS